MKQDIGYNYIAAGVRRKHSTKTVAGIKLRKTIGRNHYRWTAKLAGLLVIFTPTLGRYNGKVNGWKWSGHLPAMGATTIVQLGTDDHGRPRYLAGSCGRLADAVIQAQHQAVEARRFVGAAS